MLNTYRKESNKETVLPISAISYYNKDLHILVTLKKRGEREMINTEKAYEKFMNLLSQIESSCNISTDEQMDLYNAMLEEIEDQKRNLYAELHQW